MILPAKTLSTFSTCVFLTATTVALSTNAFSAHALQIDNATINGLSSGQNNTATGTTLSMTARMDAIPAGVLQVTLPQNQPGGGSTTTGPTGGGSGGGVPTGPGGGSGGSGNGGGSTPPPGGGGSGGGPNTLSPTPDPTPKPDPIPTFLPSAPPEPYKLVNIETKPIQKENKTVAPIQNIQRFLETNILPEKEKKIHIEVPEKNCECCQTVLQEIKKASEKWIQGHPLWWLILILQIFILGYIHDVKKQLKKRQEE